MTSMVEDLKYANFKDQVAKVQGKARAHLYPPLLTGQQHRSDSGRSRRRAAFAVPGTKLSSVHPAVQQHQ